MSAISQRVAPAVAARRNVVLIFDGPSGGGKTCLFEHVVPAVVAGLKNAVQAADEAQQEAASLAGELPAAKSPSHHSRGSRRVNVQQSFGTAGSNPTEATESTTSPTHGGRGSVARTPSASLATPSARRSRSSTRGASSMRPASAMRPSSALYGKFSLLFAGGDDDIGAVDLREAPSGSSPHARRLLPDLMASRSRPSSASPTAGRASRNGDADVHRGIFRPSLARARSPVRYLDAPVVDLGDKNGRSALAHSTLSFADEFVLDVPRWGDVDALLGDGTLRFSLWLRPADTMTAPACILELYDPMDTRFHLSFTINVSEDGDFDRGSAVATLRDAQNRKLSVAFPAAFPTSEWQFFALTIAPAANTMTLVVNGRTVRPRGLSADTPQTFHAERPKFGRIGACKVTQPDGEQALANFYEGLMYGLTLSDAAERNVACHYPLTSTVTTDASDPNAQEGLPCTVGYCGALTSPKPIVIKEEPFVACAPHFDGEAYVNCGSVGDFLLHIGRATIEFTIKTTHTSDTMTIIGVTDTPGKHLGFSVDLNASLSGVFQRHVLCMWVRDYTGAASRCAAELPDLFDDQWHTVQLKVVDLSGARFRLKVDGKFVNDALMTNGTANPDQFLCCSTPITIGCHNDRSARTQHFTGLLRDVRLQHNLPDSDVTVAAWPMSEGPSAQIALDGSGHGFHGVYFRRGARACACLPIATYTAAGPAGDDDDEAGFDSRALKVARFTNNIVQLAFVAVRSVSLPSGHVREEVQDVINGAAVNLDPTPCGSCNPRLNSNDRRTLTCLPQDAFVEVTSTTLPTVFKQAMHRMGEMTRAHFVLQLRLGDALFTAADLVGVAKSVRARYEPRQLCWIDALSTLGIKNKATNALNHATTEAEQAVARFGAFPQLFKRSELMAPAQSFESSSAIAGLVTHALVSGAEHTELHYVGVAAPSSTQQEVQSITTVVDRFRARSHVHAAIVMQKAVRKASARMEFQRRRQAALDDHTRLRHQQALRQQFPADIVFRKKRHALVIAAIGGDGTGLLRLPEFDDAALDAIAVQYQSQAFGCDVLVNPTRASALSAIAAHTCADGQLIVHLVGYRYTGTAVGPEDNATALHWIGHREAWARHAIVRDFYASLSAEYADYRKSFVQAADAMRTRLEVEAAKAKKGKKGAKGAAKKGAPPDPTAVVPQGPAAAVHFTPGAAESVASSLVREGSGAAFVGDGSIVDSVATAIEGGGSAFTTACLLGFDELRTAVLGERPQRGRHALLLHDTVDVRSGVPMCGATAGSGETLKMTLRSGARFLFTYYVANALRGYAVEAVRVGTHPPPEPTTLDTFMTYVLKKTGTGRPFGPLVDRTVVRHGEFVGDVLLAAKPLSSKDDRRKIKGGPPKRIMISGRVVFAAPPAGGYESAVRDVVQRANTAFGGQTELKRVAVDTQVVLEFAEAAMLVARHPLARDVLLERVAAIAGPEARVVLVAGPTLRVVVDFDSESRAAGAAATGDGDEPAQLSPADAAKAFISDLKQRTALFERHVVPLLDTCSTSAAKPGDVFKVVRASATVSFTASALDRDVRRFDRATRCGTLDVEGLRLAAVHAMSERELAAFEHNEKHYAVYEAAKQAEQKQRLAREMEQRQQAEAQRQALEAKKPAVMKLVEDVQRSLTVTAEDAAVMFSVPLLDVATSVCDAVAALVVRGAMDKAADAQLPQRVAAWASTPSLAAAPKVVAAATKAAAAFATGGRFDLCATILAPWMAPGVAAAGQAPKDVVRGIVSAFTAIGEAQFGSLQDTVEASVPGLSALAAAAASHPLHSVGAALRGAVRVAAPSLAAADSCDSLLAAMASRPDLHKEYEQHVVALLQGTTLMSGPVSRIAARRPDSAAVSEVLCALFDAAADADAAAPPNVFDDGSADDALLSVAHERGGQVKFATAMCAALRALPAESAWGSVFAAHPLAAAV